MCLLSCTSTTSTTVRFREVPARNLPLSVKESQFECWSAKSRKVHSRPRFFPRTFSSSFQLSLLSKPENKENRKSWKVCEFKPANTQFCYMFDPESNDEIWAISLSEPGSKGTWFNFFSWFDRGKQHQLGVLGMLNFKCPTHLATKQFSSPVTRNSATMGWSPNTWHAMPLVKISTETRNLGLLLKQTTHGPLEIHFVDSGLCFLDINQYFTSSIFKYYSQSLQIIYTLFSSMKRISFVEQFPTYRFMIEMNIISLASISL